MKKKPLLPKKILYLILTVGLLVSPFVFWPYTRVAFEIPKVWFVNRWIELVGIFTVFLFPYIFQKGKRDNIVILIVVGFLTASFISGVLGENFSKSFWGNFYRSDGIYTLIHLVIFFFFVTLTFSKEILGKSLKLISYSGITLSVMVLILSGLYFFFEKELRYFGNWEGAFGGPFGNPNFLAGYLLVTLPFIPAVIKGKPNWILHFIQVVAIVCTKAWAGIFGLVIFFISDRIIKAPRNLIIPIVVFIFLILTGMNYYKNNPGVSYQNSQAAESRQRIFIKGIKAFSEKPILGWGWANFDYAFDATIWPIKIQHDAYVDKAHSHLVEILVTTGVVGFLLYILLILKVFVNFVKLNSPFRNYLLLSFILFVYHSQTNVISISEELIFWLLAGVSTLKKRG